MIEVVFVAAVVLALALSIYYFCFSPSSQLFGYFPYRVETSTKSIALTFDDGPNPPHTAALIDVLRKHGVRATFFVVGKNLKQYPQLGHDLIANGHCIGNHTYRHAFRTYFSPTVFRNEVKRNQHVINSITGTTPTLFRPPWLFRLPWLLHSLKQLNLVPISGVFGSELEIAQPSAKGMVERALQKVRPGAILIFHDGYNAKGGNRRQTVETIDRLIPELRSRGYSLLTVPELLQLHTSH